MASIRTPFLTPQAHPRLGMYEFELSTGID